MMFWLLAALFIGLNINLIKKNPSFGKSWV